MYDEITGLYVEATELKPEFWVVDENGMGYSVHATLAEAKARIRWSWKREYPGANFGILNIDTGELFA